MKTIKIKPFSNCEILTGNALGKLNTGSLDPKTFKLIHAVVFNVCDQLERLPELKNNNIKINE